MNNKLLDLFNVMVSILSPSFYEWLSEYVRRCRYEGIITSEEANDFFEFINQKGGFYITEENKLITSKEYTELRMLWASQLSSTNSK